MRVRWAIGLIIVLIVAIGLHQVVRVATSAAGRHDAAPGASARPAKTVATSATPKDQVRPAPENPSLEAVQPGVETVAKSSAQQSSEAAMQPVGYAGPERWRRTPVPCWGIRGTAPEDFEVTSDRNEHTAGNASVLISSAHRTNGWGTLYQFVDAEPLRGKRIEFTADLRTFGVENEAGLIVRVDDSSGHAIALDNMWYSYGADRDAGAFEKHVLSGDNDWTSTSVVLDIPAEAHAISYGAALTGPGKVWVDNAHIEVVSSTTPITAFVRPLSMLEGIPAFRMGELPSAPRNLDFEPAQACE